MSLDAATRERLRDEINSRRRSQLRPEKPKRLRVRCLAIRVADGTQCGCYALEGEPFCGNHASWALRGESWKVER